MKVGRIHYFGPPNVIVIDEIPCPTLTVEVGTVLPLDEARTAHEMLAGAPHKRGKIVLTNEGV